MQEQSKYLRWIVDFVVGVLLIGLTINNTADLMSRPQSEIFARWGWFCIFLYITSHALLIPAVRNHIVQFSNSKRSRGAMAYLLACIVGAGLASLYLFISTEIVQKLGASAESIRDTTATLALANVAGNPLPSGKEVNLKLDVANSGDGEATNVMSAYYLYVRAGLSANALKDGMDNFLPQWPGLRRLQKQSGKPIAISAKNTKPLFHIVHPISTQEYSDILDRRIFVVVFGAVRYQDSKGIHELHICRYLDPPFDNVNWRSDDRFDNKIADIKQAQLPIQVAHDPVGTIPIAIPQGNNFWIATFTDEKAATLIWHKAGPLAMPVAEPKITIHGEQLVTALAISNHSATPILNLNTTLQFEFRAGSEANTEEKINALIQQENLGTRSLPLSIEALAPGQDATVLMVNQSKYSVIIHPVLAGTLELQGEIDKHEVEFKLRQNNAFDKAPMVLSPSPYLWDGDKIVGLRTK